MAKCLRENDFYLTPIGNKFQRKCRSNQEHRKGIKQLEKFSSILVMMIGLDTVLKVRLVLDKCSYLVHSW